MIEYDYLMYCAPRHLQISSTRGPPRSMSRRGPPIRRLRDSHHHLGMGISEPEKPPMGI